MVTTAQTCTAVAEAWCAMRRALRALGKRVCSWASGVPEAEPYDEPPPYVLVLL